MKNVWVCAVGLVVSLAAGGAVPVLAQSAPLEIKFYYPTAVGGPLSQIFDGYAQKFNAANPDVNESTDLGTFRVIDLAALVRIKLTAFRDKDRTHLRDLIDVGQIDATWPARFPAELAARLRQLLDDPDG